MAQRIIHYLLAVKLAESCPVSDRQRFLAGSLLPDAYISVSDRKITHYKAADGDAHIFDFNRFRTEFRDLIFTDDLYLGYYLHLIEDAVYRQFLWLNRYERPMNMEQVKLLHQDYHILNAVFIKRYKLINELTEPVRLEEEPITRIAPFSAETMVKELAGDFSDRGTGSFRYVNEAMMETYIKDAFPVCLREMRAVREGHFTLDAQEFRYFRENSPQTGSSRQ